MILWAVCPLGRPDRGRQVLSMFRAAARTADARLVLVRDGEARRPITRDGVSLIWSGAARGISEALNAGLAYARARGRPGDWFCKLDDDDVYHPGYLARVVADARPGVAVTGQERLWIRLPNGRLWLRDGRVGSTRSLGALAGSTLAAPLGCPDFPHVERNGEDALWLRLIAGARRCGWARPAGGHVYCRHVAGDHAWPLPPEAIPSVTGWPLWDCGVPDDAECDALTRGDLRPAYARRVVARAPTPAMIDAVFAAATGGAGGHNTA